MGRLECHVSFNVATILLHESPEPDDPFQEISSFDIFLHGDFECAAIPGPFMVRRDPDFFAACVTDDGVDNVFEPEPVVFF